jgi:hypothetical protein
VYAASALNIIAAAANYPVAFLRRKQKKLTTVPSNIL